MRIPNFVARAGQRNVENIPKSPILWCPKFMCGWVQCTGKTVHIRYWYEELKIILVHSTIFVAESWGNLYEIWLEEGYKKVYIRRYDDEVFIGLWNSLKPKILPQKTFNWPKVSCRIAKTQAYISNWVSLCTWPIFVEDMYGSVNGCINQKGWVVFKIPRHV